MKNQIFAIFLVPAAFLCIYLIEGGWSVDCYKCMYDETNPSADKCNCNAGEGMDEQSKPPSDAAECIESKTAPTPPPGSNNTQVPEVAFCRVDWEIYDTSDKAKSGKIVIKRYATIESQGGRRKRDTFIYHPNDTTCQTKQKDVVNGTGRYKFASCSCGENKCNLFWSKIATLAPPTLGLNVAAILQEPRGLIASLLFFMTVYCDWLRLCQHYTF